MLMDPQGRTFRYLRLSITDLCNYRCNYCLPDGYDCSTKPHRLDLKQIEAIVSSFARNGVSKVRITGGEPTLHRDLVEIISLIKSIPGIEKVTMTTNGYRMNTSLPKWKAAGLDALNVSCDSLDPRMFQAIVGRDALDDLIKGVDQALDLGIPSVKINTTLLKQFNFSQAQELIDWAKAKQITLRFIELMQTLDNHDYFAQNHISSDILVNSLLEQGWSEQEKSLTAGPAREFSHSMYPGKIGVIAPYSKDFCQSCNRLRVSSQGKLHLCLFGDQGYDLLPYIDQARPELLDEAINNFLGYKKATHYLHQGNSGMTSDLAMIGG